jgi:hypothetical protein
MTDLEQFFFIEYYADLYDHGWPKLNYKMHNFIILTKHKDNSGAIAECSDCKIQTHVHKNSKLGLIFDINSNRDFGKELLFCNELMIKNLLE